MEILCSIALSLRAMTTIILQANGPAQSLNGDSGHQFTWHPANTDGVPDAFWPEVSSRPPSQGRSPINPSNSPQRVLFEVFLVLASAGLAIIAVIVWAPALS
jgi:hypothetical protein